MVLEELFSFMIPGRKSGSIQAKNAQHTHLEVFDGRVSQRSKPSVVPQNVCLDSMKSLGMFSVILVFREELRKNISLPP